MACRRSSPPRRSILERRSTRRGGSRSRAATGSAGTSGRTLKSTGDSTFSTPGLGMTRRALRPCSAGSEEPFRRSDLPLSRSAASRSNSCDRAISAVVELRKRSRIRSASSPPTSAAKLSSGTTRASTLGDRSHSNHTIASARPSSSTSPAGDQRTRPPRRARDDDGNLRPGAATPTKTRNPRFTNGTSQGEARPDSFGFPC